VQSTSLASSVDPSRAAPTRPWLLGSGVAVFILALVKIAIHLYTGSRYGFFVDELYYLDCARHLASGYVDQPPLVAVLAWLERALLGDSLLAIRSLTILAGAAEVLLTGLIARELGGGRYAQFASALCVLCAPGILGADHFFSMNSFEPLFWMGCAWLLICIVRTGDPRLWLWFGAVAGLGLENKYSMGLFGFALLAGLLLSGRYRLFASRWSWIGGVIALLIFMPNLVWNIIHRFPFLELQRNIKQSGRDVALSPLRFLLQEQAAMLPLSLPVWLAGLWFFFFSASGRAYRFLGWAWIITAAVIIVLSPRIYYLFPAFPLVFAGGAVLWEQLLQHRRPVVRKGALVLNGVWIMAMILAGAALSPIVLPVLSPEDYIQYAKATHQQQPRIENNKLGPLPQLFADQFGWPEMAATVASVYNSLPADVRPRTAIFAQSYGQAGAIDFYGPRLGLPQALSGHQSHYLWGPGDYTGESMIVLGDRRERLEEIFTSVKWMAKVNHPYAMPYNNVDVYYCQGLKQPLAELWPMVKKWD
jgi:hypothetical protein